MELELLPADWKDYRRFVGLCCVPTLPFNSGKCWTVAGDKAFIGYNHPYRFSHCRNQEFSKLLINRKYLPINWLNDNVRLLNRVMVRPQYRGQGIATQLVRQTLPLVGVTYIECLTFAELIMGFCTGAVLCTVAIRSKKRVVIGFGLIQFQTIFAFWGQCPNAICN